MTDRQEAVQRETEHQLLNGSPVPQHGKVPSACYRIMLFCKPDIRACSVLRQIAGVPSLSPLAPHSVPMRCLSLLAQ